MPIQEGKLAPLFSLKDATGKTVSLKDFRGKHVIVYFYPRDNTPGCTKEACGFRDAWDADPETERRSDRHFPGLWRIAREICREVPTSLYPSQRS